jgi:hypothetical protein
MSKKLLTFLGTSQYKECVYAYDGWHSPVVRFVQEALAARICADWGPNDAICVFLTSDAQTKNWGGTPDDAPEKQPGLAWQLQQLGLPCEVKPISGFREGMNEADIWENFNLIYEQLKPGDQVWLDITNAFRSIPVFTSVLMSYAQFLADIEVQGIFYGAFEALGPAYDIESRIPNPADRVAPIVNIFSVIELQAWTNAANDFLIHGNARKLARLSGQRGYTELEQALTDVTNAFSVVRGKEIISGTLFSRLRAELNRIGEAQATPALAPILKKVSDAFDSFGENDLNNGLKAVRWCYEHQLYQQGITILRELIISIICRESGLPDDDRKQGRQVVETAFNVFGRSRDEWELPKGIDPDQLGSIIENTSLHQFVRVYKHLSHQYRNDINHAGMLKDAKPASAFIKVLRESLDEVTYIIQSR